MAIDPVAMLMADHREVEMLFAEFERRAEQAPDQILAVVDQLLTALTVHAELEETLLYPALQDALDEPLSVLEAIEEHHVVTILVREIRGLSPEDERLDAKLHVLKTAVAHHIEEEEQELLPLVPSLLTREEIHALGVELTEARHRLMTAEGPMRVTLVREFPVEQPRER
jgi:hemerythrin-like domain-containing protein